MAMIKCPECEKNVSENATACPNCGYPIKTKNKKVETMREEKIKCPECHEEVDSTKRICPYCGNPLKNNFQFFLLKVREFFHKKIVKFIFLGAILIIVIGSIIFHFSQKTIFDDYTKYLGEKATELPNSFVHINWLGSEYKDYYKAIPDSGITIFNIAGEMGYYYSKSEDVEKDMKNVINNISWTSIESQYSASEIENFVQKLKDEYGEYDKKEMGEMDWIDDTLKHPRFLTYIWEGKNGMKISFSAYEYYQDNYSWKYEDENKITTFSDMYLSWSLEDDK